MKLLDRVDYIINQNKYWEQRGKTYFDQEKHLIENDKRLKFIVDEIVKLEPNNILEVGCGYGLILKHLKERLPDSYLTGIDISSIQLDKAKEYLGNNGVKLQLHHLDASKGLPFGDDFFDLVYTSGVLMHVPHHKINRIRNEICRVSSTYIMHDENTTAGQYIEFTYDHEAYYRRLGFDILKSITYNNPSEFKFVLIEKRGN